MIFQNFIHTFAQNNVKMVWYDKFLSIYGKPFSEVPQNIIDETRVDSKNNRCFACY